MTEQLFMVGQILTLEAEANALPTGSVVLDNMGDVQKKLIENAWEISGVDGRWGVTWVAFPARILHIPPAEVRSTDTTNENGEER